LPVHAPPASHDALDVLGGAGLADGEEPLLSVRSGNAGQRADLRVRELAVRERPTRQDNHAAHERKPLFQPARASNSRMRSSKRAVAASRCADSSATGAGVAQNAGVLMFIGESSIALRRPYTPIFERLRRLPDKRSLGGL